MTPRRLAIRFPVGHHSLPTKVRKQTSDSVLGLLNDIARSSETVRSLIIAGESL